MPSKAAELRDLTDDQLLERAESSKEELFNLRFQLATGQLDNPSRIKKVRHEIARVATVMREREIEADLDAALAAAEAAGRGGSEEGTETEQ
jgi:large subunit ribosomal protein L29